MSRSLRIGRIAGIPVAVEGGLAILAALLVLTLATDGLAQLDPSASLGIRLAVASATVATFILSILAHELGHAAAARRRGVGVLGITLSLLGGYAQLDRQPPDPRSEFLIAAAGPVVNLAIGAMLAASAAVARTLGLDHQLTMGALVWLAAINVILAVLNLIPASPLDGGRVLTAALWKRLGDPERARVLAGRAGLALGATLIPLGAIQIWWSGWRGIITVVVGVFLLSGARGEILTATIRGRLARTTVGELMATDPPAMSDSLTIEQLHSSTGGAGLYLAYPVIRWGPEPVGYIVPAATSELPRPDRSWTTVSALMRPAPDVARAWTNETVDAVLRRQPTASDVLVVVHEPRAGRVVGTLSTAQLDPLLRTPDLWGKDRAPKTA